MTWIFSEIILKILTVSFITKCSLYLIVINYVLLLLVSVINDSLKTIYFYTLAVTRARSQLRSFFYSFNNAINQISTTFNKTFFLSLLTLISAWNRQFSLNHNIILFPWQVDKSQHKNVPTFSHLAVSIFLSFVPLRLTCTLTTQSTLRINFKQTYLEVLKSSTV